MSEAEFIAQHRAQWPTLRRWIDVPGKTTICLAGPIEASIAYLADMADMARAQQAQ